MTDPDRVPDPLAVIADLPEGACIIYRHFGRPGHREMAERLRALTRQKHQQFLIGQDAELALQIGADGVHFRRDATLLEPALWRERQPGWIITMAALKGPQPYERDIRLLDGLFVSSVFYSKSPSAGDPIGVDDLKAAVKQTFYRSN